ncbi:hypothetical protein CASFOL_017815 [Castilleja foliolosa]|uniref:Uncharacterized protein n=1 Tax=Castilleja foliolosa TaxID=1961234 RepID=A0ABD3D9A2_9LAMI
MEYLKLFVPLLHMRRRGSQNGLKPGGAPFQSYQMVHRFDTLLMIIISIFSHV